MQLVFVLENDSVAAVNKDTSIELENAHDLSGCIDSSLSDVCDDISSGSCVDTIGACSPVSPTSPGLGDEDGVGILFGSSGEAVGALSVFEALRKL